MQSNIKYIKNAYSKNGTPFIDTTLEAMLNHCLDLPVNGKKGQYGAFFIYDSNALGEHDEYDTTSTGIILLDLDHLSKDTAKDIYDKFDDLCNIWPSLLAIQFSSSYYIGEEAGLHIYIKSERLNKIEHNKHAQICYAIFCELLVEKFNIDVKKNIDFHNANLYQRFNMFYSTFKYNNYALEFNLNVLKFDDLEKLVVKYDLSLDQSITDVITPVLSNVKIGSSVKKLKIDRNYKIGPYTGNDIRFRISIIADKLFGDNARNFCDNFFYYDNGKSIYTHYPAGNTINPLIYKWLVKNQYIIEDSQKFIEYWISEYSEEIKNKIKKHRQLEITAPTGAGKTTLINEELARHFNSVVIVPFNVTNRLYDNLFEVNSNYNGEITDKKPLVMVWDQAVKHWSKIKDRHIIIDESHTLFLDREYRDAAIKLILNIRNDNAWVTLVSATPVGNIFGHEYEKIVYYKKRDIINLNIKTSSSIEWSQYNYIKKCLDNNWYDKIVLFDDNTAKKIYEQFIIEGYANDISYIRKETMYTQDFIDLREKEMLTKRLTICTCLAFNGLNFKNKGENILVVGSIRLGDTLAASIIQQVGRIRFSKVTGLYFYNPERLYSDDIDEKESRAIEYNKMTVNGCPDTLLGYDRRYLDTDYTNAKREIEGYKEEHSTIEKIIIEIGETGYMTGRVEKKLKDKNKIKMTLAIKRKESEELKNDIINGNFEYTEYEDGYKKQWASDIRHIVYNEFYEGITLDSFASIFNNTSRNKLVETTILNIKEAIRIIQIDNSEFEKVYNNRNMYMSMLSNEIDRKKFISNLRKARNIREQYGNKIIFKKSSIILDGFINDVIEYERQRQENEREGNIKGGKKTKKIMDTKTGIIYDSCEECAKSIGHHINYISKHKDRFVKI